MQLLAFSDLHSDRRAAERMVQLAHKVDLVVGAGDFCNCQRGIEKTTSILRRIEKPTIVVPGNAETVELLIEACRGWNSVSVLHGTGTTISAGDVELSVFGLGGGIPETPFGAWSFDFSEDEAERLLEGIAESGPSVDLLISHSPPHGVLDVSSRGRSLGSHSIRRAIERFKIPLTICGHIHQSSGRVEPLLDGHVINAGPGGLIWDWTAQKRVTE